MADKRSHIRYAVEADVNLKTEEGASYILKNGVSNISFRGATLFSPEKIELENKTVDFELVTSLSKESLSGKGKIKYIIREEKKDGHAVFKMGLEFVDINKSTILHFVNKLQEMRSSKIKKVQRAKRPAVSYGGPF